MRQDCWLLDGSLLVALALDGHLHHQIARNWFSKSVRRFATCAVTQGTLLRITMTIDQQSNAREAWTILRRVAEHPLHEFWNDGFSYLEINPHFIQGHRQITDAWLVELARKHQYKLATFDIALAQMYPNEVELVGSF